MTADKNFKLKIQQHCIQIVSSRLQDLESMLKDLSESAANETKSTAGDKYETARAMLHIEQDQVRKQIFELKSQQAVLNSIDPSSNSDRIILGSLICTQDNSCYYLSTSLGKMIVEDQLIIAISMQSPLGVKLKGLKAGDELKMNERKLVISDIL
jgi:transcription elongation GreA/GreB family factor